MEKQGLTTEEKNKDFIRNYTGDFWNKANIFAFEVSKLTDKMALSRVQLFRKLKALTDQSTSEFIRTIRLKRAAQFLDKGFGLPTSLVAKKKFDFTIRKL